MIGRASVASLVVLAAIASWGMAAKPGEESKVDPATDPAEVGAGNTAFACDLYQKLRSEPGNLFLSPYSISTALAMTYAGARGDTAAQMAKTLHFDLSAETLHPAFKRLSDELIGGPGKRVYELSVANALWGQKGMALKKEFVDLTAGTYGAGLREVDFVGATEAARVTINTWVEKETRDKIKELLKPGILDDMTRLVLTNAIYFKGPWEIPFDKKRTREAPFTLAVPAEQKEPAATVSLPMMYRKGKVRFWQTDELQVLELPYKGGDLSMVILLPLRPRQLDRLYKHTWELENYAAFEKSITAAQLDTWLKALQVEEVDIYLPRFTVTKEFGLAETLQSMGMTDAFVPDKADFSGMTENKDLFLSAVIHKAFVDVNEEGTEAAAATAVALAAKNGHSTPMFRADHPFVFLIRQVKSGSVLFMGRVMDPRGEVAAGKSGTGAADDRVFEFSSGGAYHFEGYGAWNVQFKTDGRLAVSHDVRGQATEYGPYSLAVEERDRLWKLIDAAGVAGLKSSDRMGVPDEVRVAFSLTTGDKKNSASIWGNDVRKNDSLAALQAALKKLIAELTKEKVVF